MSNAKARGAQAQNGQIEQKIPSKVDSMPLLNKL